MSRGTRAYPPEFRAEAVRLAREPGHSMREIAQELQERWEITDVAMHHRTGRLEIGEASVAIAVASPHRKDGLEACHYAIDRLKQIVPVWKKEVWTDGEHWIEGSLTPHDEASPAPDSVEAG